MTDIQSIQNLIDKPGCKPVKPPKQRTGICSLRELHALYVQHNTLRLSISTLLNMGKAVQCFLNWADSPLHLHYGAVNNVRLMRRRVMNDWIRHMAGRGNKFSSINARFTCLWILFRFGARNGYYSPTMMMDWPKPPRSVPGNPNDKTYTEAEYQALRRHVKMFERAHEWYVLLTICWHTGLRKNDASTLNRSEIDLEGEVIRKIPHKTKRFGTEVVIPIETTDLWHVLKAQMERDYPGNYLWEQGYVLPYFAGYALAQQPECFGTMFANLCRAAGVKCHGLHGMRHSMTSRLLDSGCNLITTAAITGHKRIENLAMYNKPSIRKKREAMMTALQYVTEKKD